MLLEAFERVDGGELCIAGDGPLKEMVEAAAARDPRIRLIGHVCWRRARPRSTKTQTCSSSHRCTKHGDSSCTKALRYGLPVIATDQVGAADDLIEPERQRLRGGRGLGRGALARR